MTNPPLETWEKEFDEKFNGELNMQYLCENAESDLEHIKPFIATLISEAKEKERVECEEAVKGVMPPNIWTTEERHAMHSQYVEVLESRKKTT